MKVVNLIAENFKILKAVEIAPGDGPVVIGGKNDQGKSSVMDAIWVALKGRAMAPPKPIRAGEEECIIRLDIGDYRVQRKFTAKEGGTYTDSVKVVDDRDRLVQKPQQVLDALLGAVGFDPFEFTRLRPEDQAEQLLQLVPLSIDLEEFAEEDSRDYATRRDRNRDADQLEAQISGLAVEEIPADLPDRAALVETLGNAANTNAAIERQRMQREEDERSNQRGETNAAVKRGDAEQWRAQAAVLIERAETAEREAAEIIDAVKVERERLAALPALEEPVDVDAIRTQLREADAVLAAAERQKRRAELVERLEGLKAESKAFTDAMEGRERQRQEALQKAKMPVDGLGFAVNEKGKPVVTYRDLPFSQAGKAVQIRASTAIAMAANPELRILRITDGSLLDEDSLRLIEEMAAAEDFQLWVEVVGEGGAGIIIENGTVKGAPAETEQAPAKKPAAKKAAAKPADGALL